MEVLTVVFVVAAVEHGAVRAGVDPEDECGWDGDQDREQVETQGHLDRDSAPLAGGSQRRDPGQQTGHHGG